MTFCSPIPVLLCLFENICYFNCAGAVKDSIIKVLIYVVKKKLMHLYKQIDREKK